MGKHFDHFLSAKSGEPLFHYTSSVGLLGIAQTKEIWATNVFYLNDHAEFLYALALVRDNLMGRISSGATPHSEHPFLDQLLNRLGLFNQPFELYVTSFSEAGNLLSQWRAYGGVGVGFSIGFYWEELSRAAALQGFTLAPCIYDPELQQTLVEELVRESLDELKTKWDGASATIAPISFISEIARLAPLLKHPSFAEEKEWRLFSPILDPGQIKIRFRHHNLRVIPYSEFRLTNDDEPLQVGSIYVGPCPDPLLNMTATTQLLRTYEVGYRTVRPSGIPFRSW